MLLQSDSWLAGGTDVMSDEQMTRNQRDSLDDVLQDADCQSVVTFTHADGKILASVGNSPVEYGQEVVEQREQRPADHCGMNVYTSPSDVTCINRHVCLKMGYEPMTIDVFSHLRQAFGCCECEYCGQLFLVQSDLDEHINDHAGLFYALLSLCVHIHIYFSLAFSALLLLVG